ncbi:hypothetical protein KDK95_01740 [Actinospica sp. MGRD01-02]|uniref:Fe-S cluster assembly protein HesB n=1 Tax=Actinospica acidithermotolerans TaxID=2828514 RepID=A0A941E7S4_9ACTN|nr:hypothetical protein [Actinospica acidithermotolerans]MBR7825010.1 hypothetical protein [Actinospica acidithermotolerans]
MLVTDTAAELIDELTDRPGVVQSLGLRITAGAGAGAGADGDGGEQADAGRTDGAQFAFAVTDCPGPLDEVLPVRGGRLYLDAAVADGPTDKILDARRSDDGQIVFHIGGERIG